MLAGSSLAEERVEGVVSSPDGLVTGHLAIRLDPVLQAVQLPAGIAHLDSGLANMHADNFTLERQRCSCMIYIIESLCLYKTIC